MTDKKLLTLDEYREKLYEATRFLFATRVSHDIGMNKVILEECEDDARSLVNNFYTTYE